MTTHQTKNAYSLREKRRSRRKKLRKPFGVIETDLVFDSTIKTSEFQNKQQKSYILDIIPKNKFYKNKPTRLYYFPSKQQIVELHIHFDL